jgi:hypothetical protein
LAEVAVHDPVAVVVDGIANLGCSRVNVRVGVITVLRGRDSIAVVVHRWHGRGNDDLTDIDPDLAQGVGDLKPRAVAARV